MGPLPIDAFKFRTTLSTTERSGKTFKRLKIEYLAEEEKDTETPLLEIELIDTEPSAAADRPRFWFHCQPLRQFLPPTADGANDRRGTNRKPAEPLIRDYPGIELIVFSSVLVKIRRFTEQMQRLQDIGIRELADRPPSSKALFSPTKPKIAMHRVHRLAQLPLQGSAFNLQGVQTDFSFYATGPDQSVITTRTGLSDLGGKDGIADEAKRLVAQRTWTRVFFDEWFTEFDFLESGYSLRVYDQGFDMIDGLIPQNEENSDEEHRFVNLEEARRLQYTAKELISLPKRFDYEFGFEERPVLNDVRGLSRLEPAKYQAALKYAKNKRLEYRTRLTLQRAGNVFLTGTTERNTAHDEVTNVVIMDNYYDPARGPNLRDYRDYLPSIEVIDADGTRFGLGKLEQSLPDVGYLFEKGAYQRYLEFQLSLFIGFTPVVGEAFGLYELYTAMTRGEDAFGNKLTDNQKILVAIAAILPLINLKMLKSATGMLVDLKDTVEAAFPYLGRSLREQQAELRTLSSL